MRGKLHQQMAVCAQKVKIVSADVIVDILSRAAGGEKGEIKKIKIKRRKEHKANTRDISGIVALLTDKLTTRGWA